MSMIQKAECFTPLIVPQLQAHPSFFFLGREEKPSVTWILNLAAGEKRVASCAPTTVASGHHDRLSPRGALALKVVEGGLEIGGRKGVAYVESLQLAC